MTEGIVVKIREKLPRNLDTKREGAGCELRAGTGVCAVGPRTVVGISSTPAECPSTGSTLFAVLSGQNGSAYNVRSR